jgi:hypothetical protein
LKIFFCSFKFSSDIEQSDRSNVTTDDEFYNELMDAPPEFEDRLSMKNNIFYRIENIFLVPDQCKNEIEAIEHLTKCLNRRFNAYPVVFMGTLKDSLKEAFSQKQITEVKKYKFLRFYFFLFDFI